MSRKATNARSAIHERSRSIHDEINSCSQNNSLSKAKIHFINELQQVA